MQEIYAVYGQIYEFMKTLHNILLFFLRWRLYFWKSCASLFWSIASSVRIIYIG